MAVDDTALYRKILSEAVKSIDGLELVTTAPRGSIALDKLRREPADLVLLDMFMPDMDGVETLKAIKSEFPKCIVVMVSGATTRDTSITVEALRSGAADFIAKPKATSFEEGMKAMVESLRQAMKSLGFHSGNTHPPMFGDRSPVSDNIKHKKIPPPDHVDLVVIGVSTGGPQTLSKIIPKLPARLRAPVLIVQHMPPMFTASLAEHLDRECPLKVVEAAESMPVEIGHVYIAPGGHHMLVESISSKLKIRISEDPPVNSCRPSADVLFESVAKLTNKSILAVVLTGMGEDGARGVAALKNKKCYCLSQSKATCVVFGMPQAIEKKQMADEVLDADKIADRITDLVRQN